MGPPKRHVSRQVAVPDGLGYFVFLLMRRNSSCRQRLAVAAPTAIAHPKRDVIIRLRIRREFTILLVVRQHVLLGVD